MHAMEVISHAGVDSRTITLNDQARQQLKYHFNATFHPSQAPSGIGRMHDGARDGIVQK